MKLIYSCYTITKFTFARYRSLCFQLYIIPYHMFYSIESFENEDTLIIQSAFCVKST